jgi:hypothetical protein
MLNAYPLQFKLEREETQEGTDPPGSEPARLLRRAGPSSPRAARPSSLNPTTTTTHLAAPPGKPRTHLAARLLWHHGGSRLEGPARVPPRTLPLRPARPRPPFPPLLRGAPRHAPGRRQRRRWPDHQGAAGGHGPHLEAHRRDRRQVRDVGDVGQMGRQGSHHRPVGRRQRCLPGQDTREGGVLRATGIASISSYLCQTLLMLRVTIVLGYCRLSLVIIFIQPWNRLC